MKQIALLTFAVALAGCVGPPVIPFDVGGSKADGTVIMGATTGALFTGEVQWESSEGVALKRCEAWGYSKVEAFSGIRTKCLQRGTYTCLEEEHTRTYQCID